MTRVTMRCIAIASFQMMATLMSQPDEFDPIVFVRGAVEELRRELLDFSKRNKLLSFKHPE